MVDIRSYNPTNQYFKDNFQRMAGTKTMKGDLNASDGSVIYDTGVLKRIDKQKILQNGWIVEVSDKTYNCTNDSGTLMVPKYVESTQYYTPTETVQVDVSLDKTHKIYKLLRMRLSNQEGVSVVQSNGQLTLLSPSASSILPFVNGVNESEASRQKKQAGADGSAIALRENSISLIGDVYINDTNIQDALNNTVTTTSATQMETLNTIVSSPAITIKFQHTYSKIPSLNLTNENKEKLNYTYTFITSNDKYTGVNVYFTDTPDKQEINILVVGNP